MFAGAHYYYCEGAKRRGDLQRKSQAISMPVYAKHGLAGVLAGMQEYWPEVNVGCQGKS